MGIRECPVPDFLKIADVVGVDVLGLVDGFKVVGVVVLGDELGLAVVGLVGSTVVSVPVVNCRPLYE